MPAFAAAREEDDDTRAKAIKIGAIDAAESQRLRVVFIGVAFWISLPGSRAQSSSIMLETELPRRENEGQKCERERCFCVSFSTSTKKKKKKLGEKINSLSFYFCLYFSLCLLSPPGGRNNESKKDLLVYNEEKEGAQDIIAPPPASETAAAAAAAATFSFETFAAPLPLPLPLLPLLPALLPPPRIRRTKALHSSEIGGSSIEGVSLRKVKERIGGSVEGEGGVAGGVAEEEEGGAGGGCCCCCCCC